MTDRIGTLDLHYRVGGKLAPAFTTGLDRALQSGLAEALERRLAALEGDSRAVTVVRALHAPVTLDMSRCRLDSQVVDTFSRACTTALADLLSSDPPADTVMRFDDDVAFAGAFVVALLAGSAWEHWYFGAFHRYRRADTGATLRALLEDSRIEPSALFAWLARHGHLPALLTHVSPPEARRLLRAGGGDATDDDGTAILVDCARRLLAVLADAQEAAVGERIDAFLVLHPIRPAWTSRASLSAWVVNLLRFVLRVADGAAFPVPSPQRRDALHALLAGPFDWLDAAWVAVQLCGGPPVAAGEHAQRRTAPGRVLTVRQHDLLCRLADRVRNGELPLPAGADDDTTIVHLVALAARDAGHRPALERGVVATIELAVQAMRAAAAAAPADRDVPDRTPPVPSTVPTATTAVAALRAAGPAALALLDALRDRTEHAAQAGDDTAMAGVFLLARALDDLRLSALAGDAGISGPALRAGLATLWAGQDLETDGALPLWCGAAANAPAPTGAALDALNDSLLALLGARRILDGDGARARIADDATSLQSELPFVTDPRLAVTACLLLRGWSSWLPGVADSGPLFLLRNCIRRQGGIRVSGPRVHIELDPAPLDIVLKMAGYLAPFAPVSWLGGRTVVFTLRDRVRAPPP
jgi:hypothetical protein